MSLIALAVSVALTVALTGFNVALADRSARRGRAQLAADSAALAAMAEAMPYGSGDVEGQARAFAAANGALLTDCLCRAGATAVQVEVAVEGIEAVARAVLDPTLLMPVAVGFDARSLDPALRSALDELLGAAGGRVTVVSGWRSRTEQSALWEAALERHGDPEVADDWVARPGTSAHERGIAVDLGGDLDLAASLVARLGLPLHRPMPHEPWHFELHRGFRETSRT